MKKALILFLAALFFVSFYSCSRQPKVGDISRQAVINRAVSFEGELQSAAENFAKSYISMKYPNQTLPFKGASKIAETPVLNTGSEIKSFCLTYNVKAGDSVSDDVVILFYELSGTYYLTGFLTPQELSAASDLTRFLYDYFKADTRIRAMIPEYPTAKLPGGMSELDLTLLGKGIWEHNLIDAAFDERTFAFVTSSGDISQNQPFDISVSLYSLRDRKILWTKPAGKCRMVLGLTKKEGGLTLSYYKDESQKISEAVITLSGINVNESPNQKDLEKVMSPDNKKYIYAYKGNLYLCRDRTQNEEELVLFNEKTGKDTDENYYPFEWIDNNSFVYGIQGYEWSAGCGIFDINREEMRQIEIAQNLYPLWLRPGKLYTAVGKSDSAPVPFVTDLNAFESRAVFSKETASEISYAKDFQAIDISPDGSKIAILWHNYEKGKGSLKIYSSDGKNLLQTYEFEATDASVQYLEFFSNSELVLRTEQLSGRDKFIYFVKI